MTFNLHQGPGGFTDVVGKKLKSHLPQETKALMHMSSEPVKSDLQRLMSDEQKQHMAAYRYAHGHNDHGLGQ